MLAASGRGWSSPRPPKRARSRRPHRRPRRSSRRSSPATPRSTLSISTTARARRCGCATMPGGRPRPRSPKSSTAPRSTASAEGPALAATVRSAIAGGTLGDDAAISVAWLKYVRALKAPVSGVQFGDTALMLAPPTAKQALSDLLAAPSMLVHVSQVAAGQSALFGHSRAGRGVRLGLRSAGARDARPASAASRDRPRDPGRRRQRPAVDARKRPAGRQHEGGGRKDHVADAAARRHDQLRDLQPLLAHPRRCRPPQGRADRPEARRRLSEGREIRHRRELERSRSPSIPRPSTGKRSRPAPSTFSSARSPA